MREGAWAVAVGRECSLEEAGVWSGKEKETSVYGLSKHGTEWPPSVSPCTSGEHGGAWESPRRRVLLKAEHRRLGTGDAPGGGASGKGTDAGGPRALPRLVGRAQTWRAWSARRRVCPCQRAVGSPGWDSKGPTVTETGSRDCPALPTAPAGPPLPLDWPDEAAGSSLPWVWVTLQSVILLGWPRRKSECSSQPIQRGCSGL